MFKETLHCGLVMDKGAFLLMGRCHSPQSGLSDLDSSELGRQTMVLHSLSHCHGQEISALLSVKLAHNSPGALRDDGSVHRPSLWVNHTVS